MTAEVQGKIQKFLYHLSNENFAEADKHIKTIIKDKVMDTYNNEYKKLEEKAKAISNKK